MTDLEAMDAWWRGQDPSRAPRFDLFPFPGCSGLGRLDLTKARLPRPAADYADFATVRQRLSADLSASPVGLAAPWAKYLIYYDGASLDSNLCGYSDVPFTLELGRTTAVVYLQACPDDVGAGGVKAWTATHELLHNLGAAQPARPNACAEDLVHTCDHEHDILAPFVRTPLSSALLDHNRDDFYGHGGAWPDVQDSPWLFRLDAPRPVLPVAVAGSRRGEVGSDWPGIACPPACSVLGGDSVRPSCSTRIGATSWSGSARSRDAGTASSAGRALAAVRGQPASSAWAPTARCARSSAAADAGARPRAHRFPN